MPGELHPQAGSTPANGRLMLCSDGLTDMADAAAIERCLKMPKLTDAANALVKLALDAGGKDNVSVVLIDLDDNSASA